MRAAGLQQHVGQGALAGGFKHKLQLAAAAIFLKETGWNFCSNPGHVIANEVHLVAAEPTLRDSEGHKQRSCIALQLTLTEAQGQCRPQAQECMLSC